MIRIFTLTNQKKQTLSLNDIDLFAHDPQGLGVSFSNTYFGVNASFIVSGSLINQGQFEVKILFGADSGQSYQKYYEFMGFLNHQPLTLNYSVEGKGTFSRDCVVKEISKSELSSWNRLDESFVFDFVTPWYQWVEGTRLKYVDQPGDGKIYVNTNMSNNEGFYVYDYVYEEDNDAFDGFFRITNNSLYMGSVDGSALEITIYGGENGITTPSWDLFDGAEIIQSDRYFLEIPPNYKLIVSSVPGDQFVHLISPSGTVSNVYNTQDMTKTNFVRIPIGTYTLKINNQNVQANYRLRQEWLVV